MKFLVPGKTFLLGEYSALVGGSVIGLATGPGFQVDYVQRKNLSAVDELGFSLNSPAGHLLQSESFGLIAAEFKKYNLKITDFFENCGGFGKSTAEYMSVLIPWLLKNETAFENMRQQYQNISRESGAEASGLDLAIQYFGQVTVFESRENKYSSADWKLKGYDFILVSTGSKIKTHEHLQTLDLKKISHFPAISNPLIALYEKNQAADFIQGLKEWSAFLKASGFMSEQAFELKQTIEANPDVLCAKPCGAMGADVIAVVCEAAKSESVQKKLRSLNLQIRSTSADLLSGIKSQCQNFILKIGSQHHVG